MYCISSIIISKGQPFSFLPFAFTGKRQMGAYLRSGKAGGRSGHVLNLDKQQLWKRRAHN